MEAMFFREVPNWELILKTIEKFEKGFNDCDGVCEDRESWLKLRQQCLTKDLKKEIYESFSRHAISTIGHDEKFDPVAFIADD